MTYSILLFSCLRLLTTRYMCSFSYFEIVVIFLRSNWSSSFFEVGEPEPSPTPITEGLPPIIPSTDSM